jgi:RNA polymerase sigma factor (TIGR02999 family)
MNPPSVSRSVLSAYGLIVFSRRVAKTMGTEYPLADSGSLSELLTNWQAADQQTLEALLPAAYHELRRLAHRYLQRQRPGHTLQSTALVHEAYLRLAKQKNLHFENPNQFFALAALIMRQILVDYARARGATKREGGCRMTLDDSVSLLRGKSLELIALDDALKGLARLDAQQSRIVELRFFGGLSIEETAEVLGISPATVKRHWSTARVWLHCEMSRDGRT